jgi:hypothetical protein
LKKRPAHDGTVTIGFKVESDLAAILRAIPSLSEFIRSAVKRQLGMSCPLCRGTGMTAPLDSVSQLVARHPVVRCWSCGEAGLRSCSLGAAGVACKCKKGGGVNPPLTSARRPAPLASS